MVAIGDKIAIVVDEPDGAFSVRKGDIFIVSNVEEDGGIETTYGLSFSPENFIVLKGEYK